MHPKVYTSDQHQINIGIVDPNALDVICKLQEAGFSAYLVGGSVRDLLVNKIPKDFDISTSAKPEEIKKIFKRQCLLIGRRFRLAHIRFGKKVIEVSTFRSGANEGELIVHDNIWGTEEEDVLRRDFTINGLYYNPTNQTVIDYIGGLEDILSGIICTIGDPIVRFKQDPVRMLRLLKFRARFGFKIEPHTRKALVCCRKEIVKSSPARILEEIYRMLESGSSAPFFQLMEESWLLELLMPDLNNFLKTQKGKIVYHYLSCADEMNRKLQYPLHRSILTACFLFPLLEEEIQKQYIEKNQTPSLGNIISLSDRTIKKFITQCFSHFPKRLIMTTDFILTTQYRLVPLSNRRYLKSSLLKMKEYSLTLKFLKIRATIDPLLRKHYLDTYEQYQKQKQEFHSKNLKTHPIQDRKKQTQATIE